VIWSEFTRSPAKTLALLALCPVAIYFCAPLFRGKSPKSRNKPTAAKPTENMPFILPTAAADETASKPNAFTWQTVATWLAEDPYHAAMEIPTVNRNPFASILPAEDADAADDVEQEHEQAVLVETELQRGLNLVLNGTVIGRSFALARIDQKTYRRGDRVPVSIGETNSGQPKTVELSLVAIEPHSVTLQYGANTYPLRIRNEIPENAIIMKQVTN